jgi:hypothetical protein
MLLICKDEICHDSAVGLLGKAALSRGTLFDATTCSLALPTGERAVTSFKDGQTLNDQATRCEKKKADERSSSA